MTLTIRDPEAQRMAKAIADATGRSMTDVVTDALRQRYAEIGVRSKKSDIEELRAIARAAAALVPASYADHGELLYDTDGMPR